MKMLLKDGKKKVVTLSYDDGVIFDKRLMEICDKNGLRCTFNINSGNYGDDTWDMSRENCIKLYKDTAHEVAIHGLTHPFFERLSSAELIREVIEDRRNLEKDYGKVIRGCAYPFGTYNDAVMDVLSKCGIVYARTVDSTEYFGFPDNWLALHPTCHHKNTKLMELAKNFVEMESRFGQTYMFYLWGHTYEFNNDNNWEVIEEFAEYIGGRDDIWYATNIEIYDYVTAYKRLETSYEGGIINNPSAIDVWVSVNGKEYSIKAGETLVINN